MLNTCFSYRSLEFWYVLGREWSAWPAPSISPGCQIFNELLWVTVSHLYCWIFIAGGRVISGWPRERERETIKKPVPRFLQTLPVSPPYDPTVYPYYVIMINLTCEYNYILCPRNLSSRFLNVCVVLEMPETPSSLVAMTPEISLDGIILKDLVWSLPSRFVMQNQASFSLDFPEVLMFT